MQPLPFELDTQQQTDEDELWLSDFENDDLIYFGFDRGFSISLANQSLLLFQRINGDWYDERLSLNDLRNATETVGHADEYFSQNQFGGARGIGQSIGVAMRNSLEKSKAKRETGITLHFRSIQRPTLLINILDSNERSKLMEALRQALNDQHMQSPYRVIPDSVREAFTPLTPEDIEEMEAKARLAKIRSQRTKIGVRGYLGILAFGALGVLPFHMVVRDFGTKVNGHGVGFYLSDASIYFAICAAFGWGALYVLKLIGFWIWEAKQTDQNGQPQAAR